jgi:hypothetical protein
MSLRCWAVLLAAVVLAACSQPYDKPLPSDLAKWESEMGPVLEKMPQADRDALAQYMLRHTLGSALGRAFGVKEASDPIPPGTTVRQALAEERAFEAARAQKEAEAKALQERVAAERAAMRQKMDAAVTVALVSRKVESDSYGIREGIKVTLAFENKSGKDIAGIKGDAVFTDVFGDRLSQNGVSFDGTIAAGKAVAWTGTIDQWATGFRKLRQADPSKTKFEFQTEQIVFTDGSKLAQPKLE